MFLILLGCQKVIPTALDDLCGNGFLATHSVDGYQRPVKVEQLQKLRNRRDFIGFGVRHHLPENQVLLGSPGTHRVQHLQSLRLLKRMPERFAIDGNVAQSRQLTELLNPSDKAASKALGSN